jgi:hypothetical protein
MSDLGYDPEATYPNTGKFGLSSIQTVKMDLDKLKPVIEKCGTMRHMVLVALPTEQLKMLLDHDPAAFDSVEPVADPQLYEANMAAREVNKHLSHLRKLGYEYALNEGTLEHHKPC